MRPLVFRAPLALVLALAAAAPAAAQIPYEEAVMDVGNIGVTYTNAGFLGRANVRNNPAGPPSFEYPLNSGVEHLFEAGLWVGAFRSDGVLTVRTGSITSSSGYRAGAAGYEFAQTATFTRRSTLPESPYYFPGATSHLDLLTAYTDTAQFVPGTFTPYPAYAERLGINVEQQAYGYNFPFAEYFTIVTFDLVNTSSQPWDSVYVGMYHDLVVRNVNTTTDAGTPFFNKGGYGAIDTLQTSYAFNAGGTEEGVNTYGAVTFLGAEWRDVRTGQTRFVHPNTAAQIEAAGYPKPFYNPRWWLFTSTDPDLSRPQNDAQNYEKMALPYPQRSRFASDADYNTAVTAFRSRLRTDGQSQQGNWIGMSSIGPFAGVRPGDTLKVSFALVAARKPEAFQGLTGRPVDTDESRAILASNVGWARRTYAGEDVNLNGVLDPGEDRNGNSVLDRFLIPEPPRTPRMHVELDAGQVTLYWDANAESSIDPVTGKADFEGYRIYRTDVGDDRSGDLASQLGLIAQYDKPGDATGFNNGFGDIRLATPVTFDGDTTRYRYRLAVPGLLSGWQYGFAVTAFDEGDQTAGLPPFESSRVANAVRVFPGTAATSDSAKVGVYPNPYRVNAAWDGSTNRTRKLYFTNLPARCEITVYTPAGEIVDRFDHDAATYTGEGRWYDQFAGSGTRVAAGGEHAWDLLSQANLNLSTGLYLFAVRDLDSGRTQTGRFVLIK
ncbi:MAG: hypothetical protein IAE99_02750 [Rhodothermales bacterium]|nr:hypothetical protein [Rhodothermales bacterium]